MESVKIISRSSGKVLKAPPVPPVPPDKNPPPVQIIQSDDDGETDQHWQIVQADVVQADVYFKIISTASGYVMDVYSNSTSSGTSIILYGSHGGSIPAPQEGDNQLWSLEEEEGFFKIKSKLSNLVLTVKENENGLIQDNDPTPGANQQWLLVRI